MTSAGAKSELCILSEEIKDIYLIELPDGYRLHGITEIISKRLKLDGFMTEELYCPMFPRGEAEHIISPDAGIAVFTCNNFHSAEVYEGKNIREIIKAEVIDMPYTERQRSEELVENAKTYMDKAVSVLSAAKVKHDELEEYYIDAMDFSGLGDMRNETITKIDKLIG